MPEILNPKVTIQPKPGSDDASYVEVAFDVECSAAEVNLPDYKKYFVLLVEFISDNAAATFRHTYQLFRASVGVKTICKTIERPFAPIAITNPRIKVAAFALATPLKILNQELPAGTESFISFYLP